VIIYPQCFKNAVKKYTANAALKVQWFSKNTKRKSYPKFTLAGALFDFKNGNFV